MGRRRTPGWPGPRGRAGVRSSREPPRGRAPPAGRHASGALGLGRQRTHAHRHDPHGGGARGGPRRAGEPRGDPGRDAAHGRALHASPAPPARPRLDGGCRHTGGPAEPGGGGRDAGGRAARGPPGRHVHAGGPGGGRVGAGGRGPDLDRGARVECGGGAPGAVADAAAQAGGARDRCPACGLPARRSVRDPLRRDVPARGIRNAARRHRVHGSAHGRLALPRCLLGCVRRARSMERRIGQPLGVAPRRPGRGAARERSVAGQDGRRARPRHGGGVPDGRPERRGTYLSRSDGRMVGLRPRGGAGGEQQHTAPALAGSRHGPGPRSAAPRASAAGGRRVGSPRSVRSVHGACQRGGAVASRAPGTARAAIGDPCGSRTRREPRARAPALRGLGCRVGAPGAHVRRVDGPHRPLVGAPGRRACRIRGVGARVGSLASRPGRLVFHSGHRRTGFAASAATGKTVPGRKPPAAPALGGLRIPPGTQEACLGRKARVVRPGAGPTVAAVGPARHRDDVRSPPAPGPGSR